MSDYYDRLIKQFEAYDKEHQKTMVAMKIRI